MNKSDQEPQPMPRINIRWKQQPGRSGLSVPDKISIDRTIQLLEAKIKTLEDETYDADDRKEHPEKVAELAIKREQLEALNERFISSNVRDFTQNEFNHRSEGNEESNKAIHRVVDVLRLISDQLDNLSLGLAPLEARIKKANEALEWHVQTTLLNGLLIGVDDGDIITEQDRINIANADAKFELDPSNDNANICAMAALSVLVKIRDYTRNRLIILKGDMQSTFAMLETKTKIPFRSVVVETVERTLLELEETMVDVCNQKKKARDIVSQFYDLNRGNNPAHQP